MNYASILVSGNVAKVRDRKAITSGTIGAEVVFNFDERWDGMDKTLVWKGSGVIVDDTACTGIVPSEVLTKAGGRLLVGVYGTAGDTATPTVWADLGVILPGATPSGDETTDPTLPVWAQLQQQLAAQEETCGKVKTVNGVEPDENGNVQIDALPDDAEQLDMLIEADLLPAVYDTNGAILTDENGNIILRY